MAKSIAYYFAVAIIASFVVSLFVVVLYSPSAQEAAPTPTPQAAFEGTGVAAARVAALAQQLLVQCSSAGVEASNFDGIAGVARVIKASNNVALVEINSSFNASGGVFDVSYNNSACVPRVLRLAIVDFNESQFTVTAREGNATRQLFKRQVEVLFSNRGGVQAYVAARAAVNDTVQLLVSARVENGVLAGFFAEDSRPPVQNILFARVNATVVNVTDDYAAVKQIGWNERNNNWRQVVTQLNFSGVVNLTGASYDEVSDVVANVSGGELENVSAKLRLESVVENVSVENGFVATFAANASESDVASAFARAGASNYSLPNSTLRVEYAAQDGAAARQAVGVLLGDAKISRVAAVALVDRRRVAEEVGGILPEKFKAEVNESRKNGDVVELQVFALAQDGVAAQASATEVS